MKILIVEDETAAYESLVEILKEIDPTIAVIGNTESVSQTINWLNKSPLPDLINGHPFIRRLFIFDI